jgi:hypothetical protein
MDTVLRRIVAAACVAVSPRIASAQEPWAFRVPPYLRVAALATATTIDNQLEAESSVSVLKVLDFAALVSGEARKVRITAPGAWPGRRSLAAA